MPDAVKTMRVIATRISSLYPPGWGMDWVRGTAKVADAANVWHPAPNRPQQESTDDFFSSCLAALLPVNPSARYVRRSEAARSYDSIHRDRDARRARQY